MSNFLFVLLFVGVGGFLIGYDAFNDQGGLKTIAGAIIWLAVAIMVSAA